MSDAQHNYRFKAALQNVGCTASAYAVLSAQLVTKKLTQQQVSQIISGTREFDSETEAAQHFQVLDAMVYLSDIVTPKVPINWSGDPLRVRDVLKQTFETRLNEQDPITVQNFYIRQGMKYLKSVNSAGVQWTINPAIDAACFGTDIDLCSAAVRALDKMGERSQLDRVTAPRRRSTICTSLEELGLKPEVPAVR